MCIPFLLFYSKFHARERGEKCPFFIAFGMVSVKKQDINKHKGLERAFVWKLEFVIWNFRRAVLEPPLRIHEII